MRIHFQYLLDSNNHIVACISSAKLVTHSYGDNHEMVAYNVSMRVESDPVDKIFSKQLAQKRMEQSPRIIVLEKSTFNHKAIATAIMNDIINASDTSGKIMFSTRTRNAAKAWLKKSPKNRGI